MSSHPPPVPPDQRVGEAPGSGAGRGTQVQAKQGHKIAPRYPKAGQSTAVARTTRNQGYKQDR